MKQNLNTPESPRWWEHYYPQVLCYYSKSCPRAGNPHSCTFSPSVELSKLSSPLLTKGCGGHYAGYILAVSKVRENWKWELALAHSRRHLGFPFLSFSSSKIIITKLCFGMENSISLLLKMLNKLQPHWVNTSFPFIFVFHLHIFIGFSSFFYQKACCFQLVFSNPVFQELGDFSVYALETWLNYYALPIGQGLNWHKGLTSC